ncbi:MAG: MarR family transcriptional regulator [Propionibacteriaceae bacterium]|nr:MarR family transcriptional regulator [Propionibacteriaceae bacterium]
MEVPVNDAPVPRTSFNALARERTIARFPDVEPSVIGLGLALARVAHHHTTYSEAILHRPRGLKWTGFRLLHLLWLFESLSARDLARHTQISRQTVSNITRGLEQQGWVERHRDPSDHRLMTLRLTPAGRTVIEQALRDQFRLDAQWFEVLDSSEQRELVRLLELVRVRIASQRPEPAGEDVSAW